MHNTPQSYSYSYEEITYAMAAINKQLHDDLGSIPIKHIVSVARGGVIPGIMLNYLQEESCTMHIISHSSLAGQGTSPFIHQRLVPDVAYALDDIHTCFSNAHENPCAIIIVDDLVDSGNTLRDVYDQFQMFIPSKITVKTAVSVYKDTSTYMPDASYFQLIGQHAKKWVIFPWENEKRHENQEDISVVDPNS